MENQEGLYFAINLNGDQVILVLYIILLKIQAVKKLKVLLGIFKTIIMEFPRKDI